MYTEFKASPTHEQIERRAYQIYLEHGFQPGNELGDWLAAEKELAEASERRDTDRLHKSGVPILRKYATA